jgi:hypothetical protein
MLAGRRLAGLALSGSVAIDIATVPSAPSTFRSVRRFTMRGLLGWPALGGQTFAVSLVAEGASGRGD